MAHLPIRMSMDLDDVVRGGAVPTRHEAIRVAARFGRSKDLLHQPETRGDVTTGALLDVMGRS